MKDKYLKAGEIAGKARNYGVTLMKEGALVLDVATQVENKIIELGGRIAFPVDVSLNHMAAHVSPFPNETTRLQKGDVVKLDVGAHIDGFVADTATTVEVGSTEYTKLIEAVNAALQAAIDIVKVGTECRAIGRVIQDTITGYGFSPIKNLSGHNIEPHTVHAGWTIPNFDNGDTKKLKKDMVIAIEPFATTGKGAVTEGKPSGIYALLHRKPTRNPTARKLLDFVEKNHKTLPFSVRWMKFPNVNFILRTLEREGILKQYAELPEESKGMVSQAEHSLYIDDEVTVITKV